MIVVNDRIFHYIKVIRKLYTKEVSKSNYAHVHMHSRMHCWVCMRIWVSVHMRVNLDIY